MQLQIRDGKAVAVKKGQGLVSVGVERPAEASAAGVGDLGETPGGRLAGGGGGTHDSVEACVEVEGVEVAGGGDAEVGVEAGGDFAVDGLGGPAGAVEGGELEVGVAGVVIAEGGAVLRREGEGRVPAAGLGGGVHGGGLPGAGGELLGKFEVAGGGVFVGDCPAAGHRVAGE